MGTYAVTAYEAENSVSGVNSFAIVLLIPFIIMAVVCALMIFLYIRGRIRKTLRPISKVFLVFLLIFCGGAFFIISKMTESYKYGAVSIPICFVFFIIYFTPYLVAYSKEHASQTGILVVNIFFGLTLIGWIIALVWANSNPNKGTTTIIENHDSAADELKKYKELFDSGAITNEEYEQKKRELLGFGGSPSANPAPQPETASASQSEDDFTV